MHIVVLVTAKDKEEAGAIADGLIAERLAACVNIIDNVQSRFRWEGKADQSREALLIIKTEERLFEPLAAKVKELHSYDVPEIIALPIVKGSADYLQWITDSVKK